MFQATTTPSLKHFSRSDPADALVMGHTRAETHRLRAPAIPSAFQDHDLDYSQRNPPFEYVSLAQLELKPNSNSAIHRPTIFNVTYSPLDEALVHPPSTTLSSSSVDSLPVPWGIPSTPNTSLATSPSSPLPDPPTRWLPNQSDSREVVNTHSTETLARHADSADINTTAIGGQFSASPSISDQFPSSAVDQDIVSQPQRSRSLMCEACNLSFTHAHRLNKHRNRHLRPFKCEVPACPSNGFALKKDLTRHMTTCHKEAISSGVTYKCPLSHCTYAKKGFLRKDNCNRHIRKQHPLLSLTPTPSPSPRQGDPQSTT